ncbi:MAG: response regulator [Treponema sp.]|jgi:two-component system response regulator YesN|nr:response regulator [Treponema sp.]
MYTMLVADDEPWIRERIIRSIDWAGAGAIVAGEAADGEEALRLCQKLRPDIVITDIRMPGINGLDFIKALRENGINAKIIIISGYGEFEYAQRAIKLGASDYILKPVENDELLAIVKKCIRELEPETRKKPFLNYTPETGGGRKRNTIEMALAFIREHYSRPITLTDISKDVRLNPSYFSKLFKDSTGISFSRYLTRFRMEKAVELMNDPTRRISEIANMVGYENVQYFIRVFKSFTGISPRIYKEQKS